MLTAPPPPATAAIVEAWLVPSNSSLVVCWWSQTLCLVGVEKKTRISELYMSHLFVAWVLNSRVWRIVSLWSSYFIWNDHGIYGWIVCFLFHVFSLILLQWICLRQAHFRALDFHICFGLVSMCSVIADVDASDVRRPRLSEAWKIEIIGNIL